MNDEIRCRICGSNETRESNSGEPIWINDIDQKGEFTDNYLCYECNFDHRSCTLCGRDRRVVKLHKVYDENIWIGKYICEDCLK